MTEEQIQRAMEWATFAVMRVVDEAPLSEAEGALDSLEKYLREVSGLDPFTGQPLAPRRRGTT